MRRSVLRSGEGVVLSALRAMCWRTPIPLVALVLAAGCRQPNPEWLGPAAAAGSEEGTSDDEGTTASDAGTSASDASSTSTGTEPTLCAAPGSLGEGACPAVCASCEGGRCRIACEGTSECRDTRLSCPEGWPCDVVCAGTSSCRDSVLQCPTDNECAITCAETSSCRSSRVVCGDGPCAVACQAGTNVCRDLVLQCGAADGRVQCEGSGEGIGVEPLDGSGCACEQQGCG